ncbi:hypothetical protein [Streptomyces sp. LNU-CPARS28]
MRDDQDLGDEGVMRWLDEQHDVLLGEVGEVLDVEAGLMSIISGAPDMA